MARKPGQPRALRSPRISRRLQGCIQFYRFVQETGLQPRDAANLLALANRAFSAGERECNITDYSADPQREAFEEYARAHGAETQWPGLLPIIIMGGRQFHLPVI